MLIILLNQTFKKIGIEYFFIFRKDKKAQHLDIAEKVFFKVNLYIIWVGQSVRTRQLALLINLGMLELTFRFQTLRHFNTSGDS